MVVTPIIVKKSPNGYGMILKSIRVYIGDSNDYRIHHIIEVSVTNSAVFAELVPC